MSTIFGVFYRNRQGVSAKILAAWQGAFEHWQPDGQGVWVGGSVGLGHLMLWNTPESKLDSMPRVLGDDAGTLLVTADVRLDNRAELSKLLSAQASLASRPLKTITDSELLLGAYRQWGEDAPKYLLGDFAFVILDEPRQQLFCARDHVGVKQFYYHLTDSYFIFANDLKGLVSHPVISSQVNDEAIANYLVNGQLESPELTFFKDIKKLPPAHSLKITANSCHKQCFWRLKDAPKVTMPSLQTYAEKLRELLEQAVHDRMRSDYPITAHLSGGLDSSTIAVIAARKLRGKKQKLLAFNWLHEPGEDEDSEHYEWSNSRTVAEAEGIDHQYVHIDAEDICQYITNRTVAYGDTSAFWYEYPVRAMASAKKSRTILSGWGGDELSTYHGQSYYADLFLQGKFIQLLRAAGQGSGQPNIIRRIAGRLYHRVFLVLVPRKVYRFMPRNQNIAIEPPIFVNDWFLPTLDKCLKNTPELTMQPQHTIKQHMLAYWRHGHIQARIESWATAGAANKLEYSYPLLDKRILEFIAGCPAECFVKNGIGRYLFRTAVADLLPGDLAWASAKTETARVERLVSIGLSAYKMYVQDSECDDDKSGYIDKQKLTNAIVEMQGVEMEIGPLLLFQSIGTCLSLVASAELNGKKLPGQDKKS